MLSCTPHTTLGKQHIYSNPAGQKKVVPRLCETTFFLPAAIVSEAGIQKRRSHLRESITFLRKRCIAYAKHTLVLAEWLTQAPSIRFSNKNDHPSHNAQIDPQNTHIDSRKYVSRLRETTFFPKNNALVHAKRHLGKVADLLKSSWAEKPCASSTQNDDFFVELRLCRLREFEKLRSRPHENTTFC